MQHPSGRAGFTLVELLVSLVIGAGLLLFGLPSYREWIADAELRDRVAALVGAMNVARAAAIKHGGRVSLCPSSDAVHCAEDGRWEAGWLIFADDNHDGERDVDETILRVQPAAQPGITVRGNRPVADYVSYTGLGQTRMVNGALQMGTFTVCRQGRTAIEVVLANGGRVRIDRAGPLCP
jgi:type IV fimbrial biogenesis protein FimT